MQAPQVSMLQGVARAVTWTVVQEAGRPGCFLYLVPLMFLEVDHKTIQIFGENTHKQLKLRVKIS